MRYIICEDDTSGFYFWTLISKYVLNKEYQLITAADMNEVLGLKYADLTIGIDKVLAYLNKIINSPYEDTGVDINDNIFIVCIDTVEDNNMVSNRVSQIESLVGRTANFHLVNYICFEQLLITSTNDTIFFPNLLNDPNYNYLKNHARQYGTGHSRELAQALKGNVKYRTTERIYNEVIKKAVIFSKQKIGKADYTRLIHHYILKGKWSYCWTSDCTNDCPNDRCWEATGTRIMCKTCTSPLKNKSHSCCLVDDRYGKNINVQNPKPVKRYTMRKFAEVTTCNKNLPSKLEDRIKLLFGNIQEIVKIDNY